VGTLRFLVLLVFAISLGPSGAGRAARCAGHRQLSLQERAAAGYPVNDATLVGSMFKKAGFEIVDTKLDLSVVDSL
jgi:hypothetical protein